MSLVIFPAQCYEKVILSGFEPLISNAQNWIRTSTVLILNQLPPAVGLPGRFLLCYFLFILSLMFPIITIIIKSITKHKDIPY